MYTISGWYVGVLLVSAALGAVAGVSLFPHRGRPEARWLAVVLLGVSFWSATQLVIVVRRAVGPPRPALFDRLGLAPLDLVGPYLGSAITLVALLMFALEYTGNEHFVTRWTVVAVAVVPAVVVAGAITNGHHSLFWTSLEPVGDLDGWDWTGGPLLVLNNLYSYALALCAAGVLVRWSVRARSVYRGQAAAVVAGVIVPLALNVGWFVGLVPVDLTEVGFTVTGLCLWGAMVTYDLGNLVPVARATVLENVTVGVVVVDDDDRIVDINGTAERLLGFDESVVGASLVTLQDRLEGLDRDLADTHQTSTSVSVESPRGRRILSIDVTPLYDRRETMIGRVLLLHDVTDRRERERELQRQNERLEGFASTLSHDLRNPLSVAKGRIAIAREERDGDDEHLAVTSEALDRMERLTEDTLTLARTGQPVEETEAVELSTVAEGAWGMIDSTGADLVVEDDVEFRAHHTRLQQLFENLFRNAVEHGSSTSGRATNQNGAEHGSTDGGALSDSAEHGGECEVRVRVGTCEDGFYVEDDGLGIPAEDRESVFESGYTTSEDGTGFGLAIVREVVEAHGWEVRVTESTDGGARFEITGVAPVAGAERPP